MECDRIVSMIGSKSPEIMSLGIITAFENIEYMPYSVALGNSSYYQRGVCYIRGDYRMTILTNVVFFEKLSDEWHIPYIPYIKVRVEHGESVNLRRV